MKQEKKVHFKVSIDVINAMAAYLGKQPYEEVFNLINVLSRLEKIDETEEEN